MATKKKKQPVAFGGGFTNSIQTGLQNTFKPVTFQSTFTPPPPPAPPAATPVTQDAPYKTTIAQLGQARDHTISELRGQRGRTLADYGYTAQFGPNDQLVDGSLQVDPNNPFSRAAALKRTYDQNKQGNTNSYAARGQLYSGALKNAQNANDFGFQQGQDTMQKGLIGYLAGVAGGIGQAGIDYELGSGQAYGDLIGRQPPSVAPPPAAPVNPDVNFGAQGQVTAVNPAKWIVTETTSKNNRPMRIFGDGHREILVNGQWKRV